MTWPTLDEYMSCRWRMEADPDWCGQIEWSETVKRPDNPETMALELIFVICNSGMHRNAARAIYVKVIGALGSNQSASTAFGHIGKAGAIDLIWADRDRLFVDMRKQPDEELPAWCETLPWIGKITKYHAAKNLGADVAKPDRWMDRIAARAGETVDGLCERLADASGDRKATVDLVLWWAAAEGILKIEVAA